MPIHTFLLGPTSFQRKWAAAAPKIQSWMSGSLRHTTLSKYNGKLHYWDEFLERHTLHEYLDTYDPDSPEYRRLLIWFLYYLAEERKLTESQVNAALQALQHSLRLDGHDLNAFTSGPVKLARKATREDPRAKHIRQSLRRRLPVTFDMLDFLADLLRHTGCLNDLMTYCGCLIGFHFMLRASEYCSEGDGYHALRTGDVLFFKYDSTVLRTWDAEWNRTKPSDIKSALFDLRSSKTGMSRHLYLDRSGTAEASLLDLMIHWTQVAELTSPNYYLLSHASRYGKRRKNLTRKMVSTALKQMATHFGFDEVFFSSHSLRIGGHSCGTAAELPQPSLCRIAGWLGPSEGLYRRNVPDRGVLAALDTRSMDTRATLLSVNDVRRMLPSAMHTSFGV